MGLWKQKKLLQAGDKAPAFETKDLNGESRSLDQLLARGPALLCFFKVTCPTCQFTFPFLERLHQGGAPVIAVAQNGADETREFNREFGITFPALLDQDGYPISDAFGISTVPSLFLVARDGTVSVALEGFVKREMEALGRQFGIGVFRREENVPEWKAG